MAGPICVLAFPATVRSALALAASVPLHLVAWWILANQQSGSLLSLLSLLSFALHHGPLDSHAYWFTTHLVSRFNYFFLEEALRLQELPYSGGTRFLPIGYQRPFRNGWFIRCTAELLTVIYVDRLFAFW